MINKALVIGAGIAGIQAALDIANSGYPVVLLDRQPSIGGHMAQLSETFPTLDCSQCIMTPRTVEVGHHENIKLYTYSEIAGISGAPGDFTVKIRQKAKYVNWDVCTAAACARKSARGKRPPSSSAGSASAKRFTPLSPQAVPNKPVVNPDVCVRLQSIAKRRKAQMRRVPQILPDQRHRL